MQCKWLQIFCLCAAIQFPFTVGHPNGNSQNPNAHSGYPTLPQTDYTHYPQDNDVHSGNPLIPQTDFTQQRPQPSHITHANPGSQAIIAPVAETSDVEKDNEEEENLETITVPPLQQETVTNPSKRTGKNSNGSSTTRHICTKFSEYYDCQIRDVHLKKNQFYIFGVENNPQQNLTFHESTLEYLPKSLIDAFPHVTLLNLNDLMITSIQPNAFERAFYLQTIYLANNRLTNVDHGAFSGAKKLVLLNLSLNEITSFNEYALYLNTYLQHLYLDQNQLEALPSFTKNEQLVYLNASHNNLASINDAHFSNQRNLKTLDVSFNRLKRLDLQQLNANLDLVDVSSNALTDFTMPTHVNRLNARNNLLTEFQGSQQCTLKQIDLSRNKLETQPDLGTCNSLELLDLSYNLLESFAYKKSMADLQYLKLAHNNLFEINLPTKTSPRPISLKALDLSHNKLSYGPSLSLCKRLELLALNDNNLISLRSYANEEHKNFQGYRMANNEWNCGVIEKFERLTLDKNKDLCSSEMRNESGICCRNYRKPYNDRLNEIVREADFHERSNKNKCSKPVSIISNQINHHEFHNLIANANAEEGDKLKKIEEVAKNKTNNEIILQNLQTSLNRLYSSKQNVAREIERQRQHHRVPREGLITDKDMLERIIKFVQEKGEFNVGLLKRREEDTKESNNLFVEKQKEIDGMKKNIKILQNTHTALKQEEKDKKKKKDELQRKANKNSASIRGSTGQISK